MGAPIGMRSPPGDSLKQPGAHRVGNGAGLRNYRPGVVEWLSGEDGLKSSPSLDHPAAAVSLPVTFSSTAAKLNRDHEPKSGNLKSRTPLLPWSGEGRPGSSLVMVIARWRAITCGCSSTMTSN